MAMRRAPTRTHCAPRVAVSTKNARPSSRSGRRRQRAHNHCRHAPLLQPTELRARGPTGGSRTKWPAAAAPLLEGAAATERYREGCPGCRLAEANEAKTGVPCLSFLYIWVVCLVAGESPPPAGFRLLTIYLVCCLFLHYPSVITGLIVDYYTNR